MSSAKENKSFLTGPQANLTCSQGWKILSSSKKSQLVKQTCVREILNCFSESTGQNLKACCRSMHRGEKFDLQLHPSQKRKPVCTGYRGKESRDTTSPHRGSQFPIEKSFWIKPDQPKCSVGWWFGHLFLLVSPVDWEYPKARTICFYGCIPWAYLGVWHTGHQ